MTTSNDNGDWRHRAVCRDEDPDLFFPVSEVGPGARQVTEAKAVCARCPVRTACLTDSLDRRSEFGIFGGMTETERSPLLRERSDWTSEAAASDTVAESGAVAGPSQQDIAKRATRSIHNRARPRPTVGPRRG